MKKLATAVSAAGALIASAVLCSGVASADPTDDSFLHALDEDHVTYGDPGNAINYAKQVCNTMRSGVSANRVITQVQSANPKLTQQGAGYFVAAAMAHYCSDQVPPGNPAPTPSPPAPTTPPGN